jgi:hypothetical protein
MADNQMGAIITNGPKDWQIVQQDSQGFGTITVGGRWVSEPKGKVEIRLAFEDTGTSVNHGLDWQPALTTPDGQWSATLTRIPAGGLYRLETRFRPDGQTAGEWAPRGDMRHFLGVGDLWVIAGQSNSAGYGRAPVYDPPELGIHLFRNSEQWALAAHPMNESTDTKHPVNSEGANSYHSPYLQFARVLKQQLNHPIGLIQTSLGGSALASWNPTQPGNPVLYRNMLHCVELAGGRVKGVVWYQGESDTGGEKLKDALTYEERFIKAVQAWRNALKNPDLAVITVQLNRVYGVPNADVDRGWSAVREAQRQAARKLNDVAIVPTLDLSLADCIHINSSANLMLAERMARAALGMVHHRPIDWKAPDLKSAEKAADGKSVELVFDNVTSRMDCIDPTANCFRVEDTDGVVPIDKVVYPQNNNVRLFLTRPLKGKTVVHGGYGFNPPTAPMDVERFMPMLGFWGVEI